MNLSKLFETQKKLDERIVKEKGLEGQDLLPEKILALQVELGELANEWRGFKFWSEDRESRVEMHESCKTCFGAGFDKYMNGMFDYGTPCPTCNGNQVIVKNPLLEEYVDCLHFILSIGLELNYTSKSMYLEKWYNGSDDVVDQFSFIFWCISQLKNKRVTPEFDYFHLFGAFLALGEMLGFTWEQIETAYFEKNKINHARQENGY